MLVSIEVAGDCIDTRLAHANCVIVEPDMQRGIYVPLNTVVRRS